MFTQENKNEHFLESNHGILYFTCLRSCGKNFMLDCKDWKILAFEVEKKRFFEHYTTILAGMLACELVSVSL